MAQNLITAVVLRKGAVEWTTIRQAKAGFEVADRDAAALELPAQEGEPAATDVGAALKKACGSLKGRLCVAAPSEKTLLRVVDLPTADAAEMGGMVDLQVDKFSPFPVEHMSVSFEVLARKEKSSRVLIAAIQRDHIDHLGAVFARAGLLPHWIDVEVLAWWHLLKQSGAVPEAGRKAILLLDRTGTELIVAQDGVPVVFRSLGTAEGIPPEEFQGEVADETAYTLTALEAERGSSPMAPIGLWYASDGLPPKLALPGAEAAGDAPAELLAKLRTACELDVQSHPLESLGPLSEGLARRTAVRQELAVDLAPAEWHTQEQSRKTKRTLLTATAVFLAVWLLAVGGFVAGLQIEKGRLAALKASVGRLEGPAQEVRDLQDRIRSFEQYADRTHSALECLREVSAALPEGIDLVSFSFRKEGALTVRGEAASAEPVYDFFQALEQSELFDKVEPEAVRQRTSGGAVKSEFSVTCRLPGAPEKEEAPL